MSKKLVVLLAALLASGCEFFVSPQWKPTNDRFPDEETFDGATLDERIANVLDWMVANIEYASNEDIYFVLDYWALPRQTYKNHKGNCVGFSLLAAYFCWHNLGIEDVYLVETVVDASGIRHGLIKVNGRYLEPQVSGDQILHPDWFNPPFDPLDGQTIVREYYITEALWLAVNWP
jgi:hypothetical protein